MIDSADKSSILTRELGRKNFEALENYLRPKDYSLTSLVELLLLEDGWSEFVRYQQIQGVEITPTDVERAMERWVINKWIEDIPINKPLQKTQIPRRGSSKDEESKQEQLINKVVSDVQTLFQEGRVSSDMWEMIVDKLSGLTIQEITKWWSRYSDQIQEHVLRTFDLRLTTESGETRKTDELVDLTQKWMQEAMFHYLVGKRGKLSFEEIKFLLLWIKILSESEYQLFGIGYNLESGTFELKISNMVKGLSSRDKKGRKASELNGKWVQRPSWSRDGQGDGILLHIYDANREDKVGQFGIKIRFEGNAIKDLRQQLSLKGKGPAVVTEKTKEVRVGRLEFFIYFGATQLRMFWKIVESNTLEGKVLQLQPELDRIHTN